MAAAVVGEGPCASEACSWVVGRAITNPKDRGLYRHEGDHPVNDAEAQTLSRAVGALSAFSGYSISQRAVDSANTFLDMLRPDGSFFRLMSDPAFRNQVSGAAEQTLTQFVAVRRRTEKAALVHFGNDAEARVIAVFQHDFVHDGAYRTMWELRNATEHGHSVTDMATVRSDLKADGTYQTRIMLNLERLCAAVRPNAATVLRQRWGPIQEADLIGQVRLSIEGLKTLMARVYLTLEPELLAAADKVTEHIHNIVQLEGEPILYRLSRDGTGAHTVNRVDLSVVDLRAIHIALDASRDRLAPPRVGTDGVLY